MRNVIILLGLFLTIISSCGKKDIEPKNVFTVDGRQISIDGAYIDDKGTNLDVDPPVRRYAVKFYQGNGDYPHNVMSLLLYSTDTERLNEGDYSHSYDIDAGSYSYMKFSMDVTYDEALVKTGGIFLYDRHLKESSSNIIKVSKSGDDKIYEGDFTFEKDGKFYDVKLYFKGALTEKYIYLY